MPKIMLIEDDSSIRNQVKTMLINYNYDVIAVTDFKHIEQIFQREVPELVILDINLPYYDGNYYCRMIRKISHVPIIVTSARNSEMDQILSMELGADEYVVKPFSITVLLAKINAIMRRMYGEYTSTPNKTCIRKEGIVLDLYNFQLTYEGKMEELSKNEFRLMKYFLEHSDEVVTRETLLEELWDTQTFVDDNTLTVNVTRLKNCLQSFGLSNLIKTKRGIGYLFDTTSLKVRE